MADEFIIKCPCCSANLTIDKNTGGILKHESLSEQKSKKSLDELMNDQEAKKKNRNSQFDMLFEQEKNKKELVEKKFQQAKSKLSDLFPEN